MKVKDRLKQKLNSKHGIKIIESKIIERCLNSVKKY